MNANFAFTDTPARRRPLLFPGTRPSSSARALLVRARVAGSARRWTVVVPPRRGRPDTCAPSCPGFLRSPEFTGDLGDRPRGFDHHLHGLVFKLRCELSTPFSHRSSSVPGRTLLGPVSGI